MFPKQPCYRYFMFRRHGSNDEFSFPLSTIRTIFPNEDCLCHEDKSHKRVPLRSYLFCDWHQAFVRELALSKNKVKWPLLTATIFHTFSIWDVSVPCHPITNFKRPLISLICSNIPENSHRIHFKAVIVGRSLNKALPIFCIRASTLEGNSKNETREASTIGAQRWEQPRTTVWKCLSCQPYLK